MKIIVYADPHWASYSSIVRSRGEKYSTRLENLIQTINWVESQAVEQECNAVVCLGDFFDKSELNSEELTALQEIKWSNIKHYMLVGNHEMGRSNLELSSTHLFSLIPQCYVIDFPYIINDVNNTSLMFLPYQLEKDRNPLKKYFEGATLNDNKIIFSHNDIAGIQIGKFVSTNGFSIEEIEQNCSLFINGHLHNESDIGSKIINIGNITGQNFSEDAFMFNHKALILDTENKSIVSLVNPYAMNFYKLDLTECSDDLQIQNALDTLKYPAVVTIKTNSNTDFIVRDLLTTCDNIIECRIVMEASNDSQPVKQYREDLQLDHIQRFQSYVLSNIGDDELVLNELERVSK